MSSLSPLIARDTARFDPIYGDTRYRVPPRSRTRMHKPALMEAAEPGSARYLNQFATAFAGGLVFFSILIF